MDVKLAELPYNEFQTACHRGRLALDLGLVRICLRTGLGKVQRNLWRLYGDYPLCDRDAFIDFHLGVEAVNSLRRWIRPQVDFFLDELRPFKPLGRSQAFAMLEWGVNWSVASHDNSALLLHAGVVAKGDRAVLLPAPPGSGKSTLCAALIQQGWRLLSDEIAVVSLTENNVRPFVRPVSLKNQSIELIRRRSPSAVFGEIARDTHKGDVAHLKPPAESIRLMNRPASIVAVVQPRYDAHQESCVAQPVSQADAFMRLAENSFNYSVLAERGFERVGELVSAVPAMTLHYRCLDEAAEYLEALVGREGKDD